MQCPCVFLYMKYLSAELFHLNDKKLNGLNPGRLQDQTEVKPWRQFTAFHWFILLSIKRVCAPIS